MLKRQRPPSPPPSMSSFATSSPLDMVLPFSKRRRVLPHSSDSPSESTRTRVHWEDDEEYTDEPENDNSRAVNMDSPYKETNSVLYELHTLNRHRLLFSPHQQPPAQKPSSSLDSSLHANHTWSTQQELHPVAAVSFQDAQLDRHPPDHRKHLFGGNSDSNPDLEVQFVRERYEDTNRLLGSLFLSRRRELEDEDKETPHR
ncbi:hypothetical protein PQX77_007573 [Marasmius sp. AFHP31]|nr:hypothetical protein PQX77_007573 [Marasmius sp. AFHP31]